jgi:hypothetical protein
MNKDGDAIGWRVEVVESPGEYRHGRDFLLSEFADAQERARIHAGHIRIVSPGCRVLTFKMLEGVVS